MAFPFRESKMQVDCGKIAPNNPIVISDTNYSGNAYHVHGNPKCSLSSQTAACHSEPQLVIRNPQLVIPNECEESQPSVQVEKFEISPRFARSE
jgi:hypothetical protein